MFILFLPYPLPFTESSVNRVKFTYTCNSNPRIKKKNNYNSTETFRGGTYSCVQKTR